MEWQLRKEIVAIGKEIHAQGLVAASDGNLSIRVGHDRVLITPSGMSIGRLKPQDILLIDFAGRCLSGIHKVSSEYRLHLCAYELRPDIKAIVHAHPPTANGFTFAGIPLDACVIPEVVATLGNIPTSEYATPSTEDGVQALSKLIKDHDAVLLQRHGSVTVGKTLLDAHHKLEKLEHSAKVLLTARTLGQVQKLSKEEIQKLGQLREKLGLGKAEDVQKACQ